MLRIFKKAQQAYIADRLKGPDIKTPWAEKDGFYFLVSPEGSVGYIVPKNLMYIRLDEERKAPGLARFIDEPGNQEAAGVVYTDPRGKTRLQSASHTVYAYEKLLKPFLAIKGARLEVTGPKNPIRVYVPDNPFCVGIVLPCHALGAVGGAGNGQN